MDNELSPEFVERLHPKPGDLFVFRVPSTFTRDQIEGVAHTVDGIKERHQGVHFLVLTEGIELDQVPGAVVFDKGEREQLGDFVAGHLSADEVAEDHPLKRLLEQKLGRTGSSAGQPREEI